MTLTYTTPGRALHLPSCRSEAASIAARLAGLLAELCVATSPVILHCLGPDSALMYTLLTQVLAFHTFPYYCITKKYSVRPSVCPCPCPSHFY